VSLGGPRLRARPLLGLVCACFCAASGLLAAPAGAAGYHRDDTPLPAAISGTGAATSGGTQVGSTSNAALHMLLGLAIVCALIFALYKILRRSATKNGKIVRDDGWIQVVSSTPLAQSRALHLVRVGEELVLVGSSEQSLTPIRVYSPEEARRLGVDVGSMPGQDGGTFRPSGGNPSFGNALVETLKRKTAR